jgi:hypothetical protein
MFEVLCDFAPRPTFRGSPPHGPSPPSAWRDHQESAAEGSNKAAATIFSPTSRLFAPTASSLAKTRSPTTTCAVAKSRMSSIVAQRAQTPPPCNSRGGGGGHASKIFSMPLPAVPPPVCPTSLAAALAASGGPRDDEPRTGIHQATTRSQAAHLALAHHRQAWPAARSGHCVHIHYPLCVVGASLCRPAAGSKIPTRASAGGAARTLRVQSSMGTAVRCSYAGAKSAKKHARQSEHYVEQTRREQLNAVTPGNGAGFVQVRKPVSFPFLLQYSLSVLASGYSMT